MKRKRTQAQIERSEKRVIFARLIRNAIWVGDDGQLEYIRGANSLALELGVISGNEFIAFSKWICGIQRGERTSSDAARRIDRSRRMKMFGSVRP